MPAQILKTDLFGQVRLEHRGPQAFIRRDTRIASRWIRPVARWLAGREARALQAVSGIEGVPELLHWDGELLDRSWIDGQPMQQARPADPAFFKEALRLLRLLHRRGVAHNDTAKEPNWLVQTNGRPALVDFQVATRSAGRGWLFRLLAREDLRHLLKHKRTYAPQRLTARQRQMLSNPAWISRWWRASGKRVYLWITRRVLGWSDREGAGDRGAVD